MPIVVHVAQNLLWRVRCGWEEGEKGAYSGVLPRLVHSWGVCCAVHALPGSMCTGGESEPPLAVSPPGAGRTAGKRTRGSMLWRLHFLGGRSLPLQRGWGPRSTRGATGSSRSPVGRKPSGPRCRRLGIPELLTEAAAGPRAWSPGAAPGVRAARSVRRPSLVHGWEGVGLGPSAPGPQRCVAATWAAPGPRDL